MRAYYGSGITIDGLHTYYVVAGDTPILVHNCDTVKTIADENGGRVDSYDNWPQAREALDNGDGTTSTTLSSSRSKIQA